MLLCLFVCIFWDCYFLVANHGYSTAIIYYSFGNWIEFHGDFGRNVGVNLATLRFNKSTQTFSQVGRIAVKSVMMQCQASINDWFCIWAIKNTTADWLLQGTCWSSFEGHPSTKQQVLGFQNIPVPKSSFHCAILIYIYIHVHIAYMYSFSHISVYVLNK